MAKSNTKKSEQSKVAAGNGSLVIEGLAEATGGKRELALKLAELQRQKEKKGKAEREIEQRRARLVDLRDGTNEAGKNSKLNHNPAIVVESLRPSTDGELVGGRPAKGWVVEIACEMCSEHRLVNTQDAFQVRFCEAHKDEARKAAGKERRKAKKIAKYEQLDEAELAKQVAELEAELAVA